MLFDRHCACGIEPNLPRIEEHLADNLMLVTALNKSASVMTKLPPLLKQQIMMAYVCVDAAIASGFLTAEEFDL